MSEILEGGSNYTTPSRDGGGGPQASIPMPQCDGDPAEDMFGGAGACPGTDGLADGRDGGDGVPQSLRHKEEEIHPNRMADRETGGQLVELIASFWQYCMVGFRCSFGSGSLDYRQ